jgi:hypothetical protein
MATLKLIVKVKIPPDDELTNNFDTEKYTYVQGKYVGGTRCQKKFRLRNQRTR